MSHPADGDASRRLPPPATTSPQPRRSRRIPLLARWPVRNKVLLCASLLAVIVGTLSTSSFYGLYAYRDLVKSLERMAELRPATELAGCVSDMRVAACQIEDRSELQSQGAIGASDAAPDVRLAREEFRRYLAEVHYALVRYRKQLETHQQRQLRMGDRHREFQTLAKIESTVDRIETINRDNDWLFDAVKTGEIRREANTLQQLANELPSYLHTSFLNFSVSMRNRYRTFIVLAWASAFLTAALLLWLVQIVYYSIFRPLDVLAKGSRRVAAGAFHHRIELPGHGEMSELADAMNDMTARFLDVREDLDRQVRERTSQVVRSERMAGVGFLAAGVSHEINNPLTSIAMGAESLERRLRTARVEDMDTAGREVVANYLGMIRSEAARCQAITGRLLDFSRMGDTDREVTDLGQLVGEVAEVLRHLRKYGRKRLELQTKASLSAEVNPQEIKQVVLNLLTNALDSLGPDGRVRVRLRRRDGHAELIVSDNGCGMTEEVLQHLFEPFFTRRPDGKGTGLGLPIAERIISDHGGRIEASSGGPGTGSKFLVQLPLKAPAQPHAA